MCALTWGKEVRWLCEQSKWVSPCRPERLSGSASNTLCDTSSPAGGCGGGTAVFVGIGTASHNATLNEPIISMHQSDDSYSRPPAADCMSQAYMLH